MLFANVNCLRVLTIIVRRIQMRSVFWSSSSLNVFDVLIKYAIEIFFVPARIGTLLFFAPARIRTWNDSSEDCCDIRFTTGASRL
jgi:hypothetical protein